MIFPSFVWSKLEQSYDDIQLFEFIKLILFVLFKMPDTELLRHSACPGKNFWKNTTMSFPTSKLF